MSSSLSSLASMARTRSSNSRVRASKFRDGFDLIPTTPVQYDVILDTEYTDITYRISTSDYCARIAFNRPEVLHAFRPRTILEIRRALQHASDDVRVGVILLTAEVTPECNSFCAGGDQTVRSNDGGYDDGSEAVPRLRVLDLQIDLRRCAKPVVAVVRGYAVGGGHILHMCSDLTLASDTAVFGQTGPRMGSFDAGYGSTRMARLIGQKRAREMWFLCRFYDAREALDMGLVNAVYPDEQLEGEAARWVRRIIMNSPTAVACTKAALNADEDGHGALSLMGGHMTRLFYLTKESQEGRDAYLEKRPPDFRKLPSSRL